MITGAFALAGLLFLAVVGFRAGRCSRSDGGAPQGFSVIIPFKDEAVHLPALLESLYRQECSIPFEVICIDDGSGDGSAGIVHAFMQEHDDFPAILVTHRFDPASDLSSKQQALDAGTAHAYYDWLVFTDADMVLDPSWLSLFSSTLQKQDADLIIGRTRILPEGGMCAAVQRVQLDLLFSGAAILMDAGMGSSCMGNNLAVRRRTYEALGGQRGIGPSIVEDKRLLSAVGSRGGRAVKTQPFHACAFTPPEPSWQSFLSQMRRWFRGGLQESAFLGILITGLIFLFFLPFAQAHLSIHSGEIMLWLLFWGSAAGMVFFRAVRDGVRFTLRELSWYALYAVPALVAVPLLSWFGGISWKKRRVS
ncbi:MAG: glycosyltransferase [Fibrobacterota bacterium]